MLVYISLFIDRLIEKLVDRLINWLINKSIVWLGDDIFGDTGDFMKRYFQLQPVSYKRYFRCNNCVLLLVYAINLSLSTDLVDPSV